MLVKTFRDLVEVDELWETTDTILEFFQWVLNDVNAHAHSENECCLFFTALIGEGLLDW